MVFDHHFRENLPDGWATTNLGSIVRVSSGVGFPKRFQGKETGFYPVYKVGDVSKAVVGERGNLRTAGHFVDELEAAELKGEIFPVGTTLFAKIGEAVKLNRRAYVLRPGLADNNVMAVLPSCREADRFVYHFMRTVDLTDVSRSTTVPSVRKGDIEDIEIALPPLAEQKVIADRLDALLAQVETTKARLQRIPIILKRFRQSVLAAAVSGKLTKEWRANNRFTLSLEYYQGSLGNFKNKAKGLEPVTERDGWLSCQLGHIMSVRSGDGLTAKEMNADGNIPVYGGNGVNGYHDKANVLESEVVIGRVGYYCGSVHLTEEKAWITDNALIVNFPGKLIRKDFVYWLLSATDLRADAASSAQPVISGSKIYPIQLNIPPIEEQAEIVRRVEQLFAFANTIEQRTNAALERVTDLNQSVLAKAFSGELTTEWRKANPHLISGENSAEALLEKIKAEREQLKPKKKLQTRSRVAG